MSFTIGKLARLTGFSPMVLRAWESRHGLLQPERLENGHRRYTSEDLLVLQSVRALVDEGWKIGDIARKGRAELALREAAAPSDHALPSPTADGYLDGRHPDIAWSVLDALPLAVIVTDTRGLVRWINRGAVALCGYDLAELHGSSPGSMLQGPATERRAVDTLRAAVRARRPGSTTIVNYHKSGEPYLAQVEVVPLGVGAQHVGFVGTARRMEHVDATRPRR